MRNKVREELKIINKLNHSVKWHRSRKWRRFRAAWRDTLLLVREFIRPLLVFTLLFVGGGTIYNIIAVNTKAPVGKVWTEAVYQVFGLIFLQPLGDNLPDDPRLQLFYFVMPILGFSILAQGLTDFGLLLFNRRSRSKEWEMAVASTFNNHVILVGLGHLGFRVTKELHGLGQDTAVIELNPNEELTAVAKNMNVPVIPADARQENILIAAGIKKARTLLLCTQNDSVNLQIGLKARKLNPDIQIIARIFDDEFASMLQEQFGFQCMSATHMAAPKFAAAAAGVDITRPITVEGESFSLARFNIKPDSKLIGNAVAEVEQTYDVSVVLLRHNGESDFHPAGERSLQRGDVLAIFGGSKQISHIVHENN